MYKLRYHLIEVRLKNSCKENTLKIQKQNNNTSIWFNNRELFEKDYNDLSQLKLSKVKKL